MAAGRIARVWTRSTGPEKGVGDNTPANLHATCPSRKTRYTGLIQKASDLKSGSGVQTHGRAAAIPHRWIRTARCASADSTCFRGGGTHAEDLGVRLRDRRKQWRSRAAGAVLRHVPPSAWSTHSDTSGAQDSRSCGMHGTPLFNIAWTDSRYLRDAQQKTSEGEGTGNVLMGSAQRRVIATTNTKNALDAHFGRHAEDDMRQELRRPTGRVSGCRIRTSCCSFEALEISLMSATAIWFP
ncbi:hypothetical protein C8J57DRAFT_1251004 [Mycena rebaudengoi]|nr:hypothetical protein C8J57DRAFT_1251004 [Mycena rebaudengoi]